jgi:hypothetical protein
MNLIACLGLVWIIKDSYIFQNPRNKLKSISPFFNELFNCALCIGFWVGIGLSFFEYFYLNIKENLFYNPFASSAFCWFFDSILDLVQEQYVKLKKKREKNS